MNNEKILICLPYQIGTVVETYQNGQKFTDRVREYIISDKIMVILDINCEENAPSTPIELGELKKRWKSVGRKNSMVIELPYEVDTVVTKQDLSGRVFSYTVNENKITAIIHLKGKGDRSRLSSPIDLEELKGWEKV